MVIAQNEPDVILITEVIPKAQILPIHPALLALPKYNIYVNVDLSRPNLGASGQRGVCIYVKEHLSSHEVTLQTSSPTSMEQLWIMIDLRNGDKLLIGCIYLSPSGDSHLGITELDRSLSLAGNLSPSHILVVGDFNVPQIDWASCFSDEPPGHYSHRLISCVQDHFLTQHVTAPTRYRLGQIPNMLDLIFTN